jgi:hypothetical protein
MSSTAAMIRLHDGLDASQILRVAITVEKFDCKVALAFAIKIWLNCANITNSKQLWRLLRAVYWFDNAKSFEEISLGLILHHRGSYLQLWASILQPRGNSTLFRWTVFNSAVHNERNQDFPSWIPTNRNRLNHSNQRTAPFNDTSDRLFLASTKRAFRREGAHPTELILSGVLIDRLKMSDLSSCTKSILPLFGNLNGPSI